MLRGRAAKPIHNHTKKQLSCTPYCTPRPLDHSTAFSCQRPFSLRGRFRLVRTTLSHWLVSSKLSDSRDCCSHQLQSLTREHHLLLVANANSSLGGKTLRPVSSQVDVGLCEGAVADEQPETEDRLHQKIEDSIDEDLGVDARPLAKRRNSPDTTSR